MDVSDPLDELAKEKVALTRGGRAIESRGAPEKPSSGETPSAVQEIVAFLPPGVKPPKALSELSEWQAAFTRWEASKKAKLEEKQRKEKEEYEATRWKPRERSDTQDATG